MKAYWCEHKLKKTTTSQEKQKQSKVCRLSDLDVCEFVLENNAHTDIELFSKAKDRKEVGKKELANFLVSCSRKSLQNLLLNTWKIESTTASLAHKATTQMEVMRKCTTEDCMEGCNGEWLVCAKQFLTQNKVHAVAYALALRDLLVKGHGKSRNIMIMGPANCAKTVLFKCLQTMFTAFSNPSNDKYAWIGAEDAEVIFLNEFRWTSEMIAWKELLLLLERQIVHLPPPKNHYESDTTISSDVPIFATGKSRIVFRGRGNSTNSMEDDMMAARWIVFKFFSPNSK